MTQVSEYTGRVVDRYDQLRLPSSGPVPVRLSRGFHDGGAVPMPRGRASRLFTDSQGSPGVLKLVV